MKYIKYTLGLITRFGIGFLIGTAISILVFSCEKKIKKDCTTLEYDYYKNKEKSNDMRLIYENSPTNKNKYNYDSAKEIEIDSKTLYTKCVNE